MPIGPQLSTPPFKPDDKVCLHCGNVLQPKYYDDKRNLSIYACTHCLKEHIVFTKVAPNE